MYFSKCLTVHAKSLKIHASCKVYTLKTSCETVICMSTNYCTVTFRVIKHFLLISTSCFFLSIFSIPTVSKKFVVILVTWKRCISMFSVYLKCLIVWSFKADCVLSKQVYANKILVEYFKLEWKMLDKIFNIYIYS